MKSKRALYLPPEEIEQRRVMVDLRYGIYRRQRARTFEEWLNAQMEVDKAFRAMGYPQNGYTYLADQELIFPNVMRRFNGQDQNRMDGDVLERGGGTSQSVE